VLAFLVQSIALNVTVQAQYTGPPLESLAVNFRALGIEDGLSQGMVNAIAQDPYGFLWFGTKDGLDRYDGYGFTVFRHDPTDSTSIRDGFIFSLRVDGQGRLWVGTSTGVDLFDARTETFAHVALEAPSGQGGAVTHIAEDMNGDLWLGRTQGLVKLAFTGEKVTGKIPAFIAHWYGGGGRATVSSDPWGALWGDTGNAKGVRITPRRGGADLLEPVHLAGATPSDTLPELREMVVVCDSARHRIYGIHQGGVVDLDPAASRAKMLRQLPRELGTLTNSSALLDAKGTIWIPAYSGLYCYNTVTGGLVRVLPADPKLAPLGINVKSAFLDRGGVLWIGTAGYGILKYDPRIERFNTWHDGSIRSIQNGADGTMLITLYDNFLSVFDPRQRKYTRQVRTADQLRPDLRKLLPYSSSDMAVQAPDGAIWFSLSDGYMVRHDPVSGAVDPIQPRLPSGGVDGGFMFPLLLGANGQLWCGGDSALWRTDLRTRERTSFRWPIPSVDDPYAFTTAIHEGPDGILWVGTMRGLLRLDPHTGGWKRFTHDAEDEGSLAVNMVFSIAADPQEPANVLWIGTNGGGLNRFDARTGKVKRYTAKDGLPNEVVYGVLADDDGDLWMSTNKGISRFDPRTSTPDEPGRGRFRNFGVGDGLQSDEFNRHAYCKDGQGRLWFGGVSGFNYFDPKDLAEDTTPVTVRITGVKLMNKPVAFGEEGSPLAQPVYLEDGMTIPYSSNMVTFSFASMEFASPELHEYRYKLVGFDPDWIDAGNDNAAVYTNLDPGSYTFRVASRNRDGIWDAHGTSFQLLVRPPWYRTWWSYILCGLVVIGGTWLYVRRLRKQREVLERTVEARTQELRRAKDRSDELLNNILPSGLSAQLKRKGHIEARHYDQVTVLFSDIKEFTRVSEHLSPAELVDELNVCFNAFDRIMEKYGIEKIKTIGDAYVAAGGVPDPSGGTPIAVVHAGLEMQRIVAERRAEREAQGRPAFAMRVGIHSGPVVAGIVGRRKFQYDIWGDTVDTARRMESNSPVGDVTISRSTFELLQHDPDLSFETRGKVGIKSNAEMEMFVVRLRTSEEQRPAGPIARSGRETSSERETTVDPVALKGLHILIAEDNEFNAMVAQGQLEDWVPGVKILHAVNGVKAVEAVRADRFDVVLMDIQMPEMNGYDATRAIRSLPGDKSRIPIIAMSANVMKAEIDRCTEAGMNAFVPKPYKREELMAAIASVINRRTKQ
jgi:class 3 adenylate cyclase/ligand-binding sensor domain-containing protein/CheY-like chemotaxis protein